MENLQKIIKKIDFSYQDAINSVIAKKGDVHDKDLAREWLEDTLNDLVDDFNLSDKWAEKCNDYLRIWYVCLPDEQPNEIDQKAWKLISLINTTKDLYGDHFANLCLKELSRNLSYI